MKWEITLDNLSLYAHTNEAALTGTPRGVALFFHGLDDTRMPDAPSGTEAWLAARGVLTVAPYDDPWSWMNDAAIRFADRVLAAALERFRLPEGAPCVSAGGSMGGLSALVYARYARRAPVACAANCPVCDLPFHAGERKDLPRTLYAAFADDPRGMDAALRAHSPLHLAGEMPRVPYYVVYGGADEAVNPAAHALRFVDAMRRTGQDVTCEGVDGMAHCDLSSHPEAKARYLAFVARNAGWRE